MQFLIVERQHPASCVCQRIPHLQAGEAGAFVPQAARHSAVERSGIGMSQRRADDVAAMERLRVGYGR